MTRCRLGIAATMLMPTFVLTAACSGHDGEQTSSNSKPSASSSTSYEQAVKLIPLDGTKEMPLSWRLPESGTPDENEALTAARRYLAFFYYLGSLEQPAKTAQLSPHIATKQLASEDIKIYGASDGNPDPSVGPLWIWVLDMDMQASAKTRVDLCMDLGWHERRSVRSKGPRPPGDRLSFKSIEVEKVQGGGEPPRWKAADFRIEDDKRLAPRYKKQCQAWAKHTRPK